MPKPIYLDNNATTPLDPRVRQVVAYAMKSEFGNPSSVHFFGREARNQLTRARREIANFLNVSPSEIVFTSGGTEGANMVLRGYPYKHLITSTVEHSCVYEAARSLDTKVSFLNPGSWGAIQPNAVADAIRSDTELIALMAANNETGVKTNIESIAELAKENNIPFFVDGVALLGKEPFEIPEGVAAMSFSGHKIHAPKGVGCLYLSKKMKLKPLFSGGGHEGDRRPGTENYLGVIGFAQAIRCLQSALPQASQEMKRLRDHFENTLISTLGDVVINGEGPRVANTSNLSFLRTEGESVLMNLDLEGVAVSHGSACSSGSLEPSRILKEMGVPKEVAEASIRFSLSRMTTQEEINRALDIIISVVSKLRAV